MHLTLNRSQLAVSCQPEYQLIVITNLIYSLPSSFLPSLRTSTPNPSYLLIEFHTSHPPSIMAAYKVETRTKNTSETSDEHEEIKKGKRRTQYLKNANFQSCRRIEGDVSPETCHLHTLHPDVHREHQRLPLGPSLWHQHLYSSEVRGRSHQI